jgi:DNA polymerase-3 subunit delta
MELQKAIQALEHGQFDPIYVLQGPENYLIDRFLTTIQNRFLTDEVNSMNYVSFDLEEDYLTDAMIEANTISFFNEPRLIILRHPLFLTGKHKKGAIKQDDSSLLAYMDNPAEEVIVVIVADYESLDSRKKIVKELKKKATFVDTAFMAENQVKDFMQRYVKSEGVDITREAMGLFLERTHYQLTLSVREMDKLMLYVGEEKKITQHDVNVLVSPTIDDNIFHLTDYIMRQDAGAALAMYRELIAQKQQPIAILGLLQSNFRLYTQIVQLSTAGYDQGSIAKTIGGHPYRIKMAAQAMRAYAPERLMLGYMKLIELDFDIKQGRVDQNLGIEWFILDFCGKRAMG